MKNVSKYLQDARRDVHSGYMNADGAFSSPNAFPKNGFAGTGGMFANAAGTGAVPTSQPYIINITNASAAAVADVDVFGSIEYLGKDTGWSAGSYTANGVTISSGMPGVTYKEMLYQFQNNPFSVGLTYFQSATSNQVLQTMQVIKKDANGNVASRPIIPNIDPYQQQATIVPLYDSYDIDGFTKLRIASVLASAVIQLKVYPGANVNLARGLEGQTVSKEFGDPNIIKAQPVVVK